MADPSTRNMEPTPARVFSMAPDAGLGMEGSDALMLRTQMQVGAPHTQSKVHVPGPHHTFNKPNALKKLTGGGRGSSTLHA